MMTIELSWSTMGFLMGAIFFMTAAINNRPLGYLAGVLLMLINYVAAFRKEN